MSDEEEDDFETGMDGLDDDSFYDEDDDFYEEVEYLEDDDDFVDYVDEDYDNNILAKGYKLSFNKNILKINLFEETVNSEYSCQQLNEILTEAMKKQLLQNFLLQKNSDRM